MDTSKPITPERIVSISDSELETLTTKHALVLYRSLAGNITSAFYEKECGYGDGPTTTLTQAAIRLKALLDTRPHVPNKKESKAARQAAAKRGR